MRPIEIYKFINCSKQYLNGILNFKLNANKNFKIKPRELENASKK